MTYMPPPNIRKATAQDAPFILEMSEVAGHGFLPHYFMQLLPEGQDLHGFMLSCVENPQGKMSYTKCWIAEFDGSPVGMTNLDRISDPPEPIDPDLPPMFKPPAELEASVPGALLIVFLATVPVARGKGVGAALIANAKDRAGSGRVALFVSNNNTAARVLYQKAGFAEADRRPIVTQGWQTMGTEWILMEHY
ncbi:MAG: GNAT family N-acetyltransferase [Sulfitobacter sp.]